MRHGQARARVPVTAAVWSSTIHCSTNPAVPAQNAGKCLGRHSGDGCSATTATPTAKTTRPPTRFGSRRACADGVPASVLKYMDGTYT